MLKLVEVVKIHSTDKPWMSLALKHLITQRQRDFHSRDQVLWRHLRTKVCDEIFKRKQSCYANKVRHLKTSDSRKWWNYVKQLSGNRKFSNMQIVKDGISVGVPTLLVCSMTISSALVLTFTAWSCDFLTNRRQRLTVGVRRSD